MAARKTQGSTPRTERLRACWHGVAYSSAVGTTPYRTHLLGEQIVVWRDGQGTAHAFRDLCIHRGTALSLGSVTGDEIVCPYHGWRYAVDGRCTAIPQLPDRQMDRIDVRLRRTRQLFRGERFARHKEQAFDDL